MSADSPREDYRLAQRGPNTHYFMPHYGGTTYLTARTVDVDGIEHFWEVPAEVVAGLLAATPSAEPPLDLEVPTHDHDSYMHAHGGARHIHRFRPSAEPAGLREALVEVVAAFTAKPDTDELDHPGGLTTAQVELAWAQWDLRQQKALAAVLALLPTQASDSPETT